MNNKQIMNLFIKSRFVSMNGENLDPMLWRRDKASAIIKFDEFGKETEFGWKKIIINPEENNDNSNNWLPIHWSNDRPEGSDNYSWNAKTTRHSTVSKNISKKTLIRLKIKKIN